NSRSAGIGAPPGTDTGHPLVDYNLWLKVPGESDGTCSGRTPDAQEGPSAGLFFPDGFASLWDNSWFVDVKGLPKINGGGSWTAQENESGNESAVLGPTSSTPAPTNPAVQSRVATSTDKPNEVISVQSSVETTNITTGMIVLIAGVAAAAVVATVLAVMVIRKRNAQEKHNDRLDSQGGVVALGVTHGLETERCMQML
ncbi:hypothetical protein DYB35_013967, partial [Aphanomyces astaci]